MNKLNLFSLIGLFFIPSIIATNNTNNTNNTIINIGLYENYNDCISQTNILYNYKKYLDIKCNCFLSNDCYNKLTESVKFKTYFFYYDNMSIYLDELNFKDQCYRFTILSETSHDIYVYNEMTFYQYCGGLIVFLSLFILCIITISILSVNYIISKKTKKKDTLLTNIPPPLYQAIF
jgi:hypothetical protein